ncbi:hypothetical protein PoB_005414600 [Plakobranchus ocellatus]|uniref:Uncharacterized protein n=1 Tax=Plakobranchus ocellatus TaxID=259542 RepID=A0AAV4BWS7_9GAST|nr:hypothetical protein PoB_005414600 [Plakobranchus ocellatus]
MNMFGLNYTTERQRRLTTKPTSYPAATENDQERCFQKSRVLRYRVFLTIATPFDRGAEKDHRTCTEQITVVKINTKDKESRPKVSDRELGDATRSVSHT